MKRKEKIINFIFLRASGNISRKKFLTPVMGFFFLAITSLFVIVPLYIDNILGTPRLVFIPLNYIIGSVVIVFGAIIMLLCFIFFIRNRGTPVPVNPPKKLLTTGMYAFSRNPMTSGLFLVMFGIGIYSGSVLSAFVFTPLYILIHYFELKNIEEPELEKRLGEEYINYKKRVPMFFPRI